MPSCEALRCSAELSGASTRFDCLSLHRGVPAASDQLVMGENGSVTKTILGDPDGLLLVLLPTDTLGLSQDFQFGTTGYRNRGERMMKSFKHLMNNLLTDESGQDLIEYALVAALVALGAVASMKSLATTINSTFISIGSTLTSAT